MCALQLYPPTPIKERGFGLNTDLTQGNPTKLLWKFSIPMIISVMFQQLYNMADSVIAGKFAGEDALAAVGSSYPITMIFMAIALGCNAGCNVVISRLFGSKEYRKMKIAIHTTFLSVLILSALLTIIGFFASSAMMRLIRTPENIFIDAREYLRIYIYGLIFLFFYNICTGIFTALGDSKTPLYFLIASSLGNIGLDILFVAQFHMGVAGVAWATFIAQGVAAILAFSVLLKRIQSIETDGKCPIFSAQLFRSINYIALPSILQQSSVSIGNLIIQAIINGFGSSVVAGYSAAVKLNTFAIATFSTLSNGLSSYTAQNLGARQIDRVKHGYRAGVGIALIVAVIFFLASFFGAPALIRLFLDSDSTALALNTGIRFLQITTPFYLIVSVKLTTDGLLRGASAIFYFTASTFTDLLIRVLGAFALAPRFGADGVWYAWPIGWILSLLLVLSFYFWGRWSHDRSYSETA